MSFILTICTVFLVLTSLFIVLIVLMQRANANSGMGSALGGSMSESTFGAETGNVLTRWTVYAAVIFFVLSFLLYMGYMHQSAKKGGLEENLPSIKELKNTAESDPSLPLPSELTVTPKTEEPTGDNTITTIGEATETTPIETEALGTQKVEETTINSEAMPPDAPTKPIKSGVAAEPDKP